jgi:hypothetical protein
MVRLSFISILVCASLLAQNSTKTPVPPRASKQSEAPAEKTPEIPAQIELLETSIRFEADGSSRKEVHARVHMNNELGVRQFARLNFDYNRASEQIDIPLVRITHASGGTADILPSAITDQPNPAVLDAPAYQDVRVKSVRILGLAPSDNLEYRVVTSISRAPFAPNFYLSHDLDHAGIVTQELFEINLPASGAPKPWTSPAAQVFVTEKSGDLNNARLIYRWHRPSQSSESDTSRQTSSAAQAIAGLPASSLDSDVVLTTFANWMQLSAALEKSFSLFNKPSADIQTKAKVLTGRSASSVDKLAALYDFVSQKIRTVDLPLGATGYHLREPADVLSSGYGIPEEKCMLLSALASAAGTQADPALTVLEVSSERGPAVPSSLTHVLIIGRLPKQTVWLDPALEVAPFGMIASSVRSKPALLVRPQSDTEFFEHAPQELPFAAFQQVNIDASLTNEGQLTAKVRYTMRGDNELLLRVAFHESSREKWKDVAQLLSLSDGFRGKITSVTASDPYATRDPFTVEYEITQPKFLDWSKQPVRIPALLPVLSLPDPLLKPAEGSAAQSINLGTPLNVDTRLALHLPPGITARMPTGTSVERDYATFSSQYSTQSSTISASRHLNFILREVPAARAADYNAFLHAVQNDEAQELTLNRRDVTPAKAPPSPTPAHGAAEPKP